MPIAIKHSSGVHDKDPVVVTTKEELEAACKRREELIVVTGDLAVKLRQAWSLRHKFKLIAALVTGGALLIPFTGGASAAGAAGVLGIAATVGGGVATTVALTAIVAIGIVLLMAIDKGYNVDLKLSPNSVGLKLRK